MQEKQNKKTIDIEMNAKKEEHYSVRSVTMAPLLLDYKWC